MAVINTNVKALFSQAALASTQRAQTVSMQQLSTGKRINSARDDAAGMAIAARMTQQIRSMNQAVRNAGDAVSMIQTAEGATNQITDMLQRMRELAIQAANDTNSNDQRSYLDLEFQQLKKQIVQVSENAEWNGFPLLNGTAGEIVGPFPVYKATGNGLYDATLAHKVSSASTSQSGSTITTGGTGTLTKSGDLTITMSGTNTGKAVMKLDDGSTLSIDITAAMVDTTNFTITFDKTLLTDGTGTFTVDSDFAFAANQVVAAKIGRSFATVDPMKTNDVIINDVTVPLAVAKSDMISPKDGASLSSAISRAAAINEVYHLTGVRAVVQETEMSGTAMVGPNVITGTSTGTVSINGYTSAEFTTVENNTRASREAVVKAINMISNLTGVVATDTGLDQKGIELKAADGRNIEVAFNTKDSTMDQFATRSGLKQGLQIGTYALESKVETPVKITSAQGGSIARAGLSVGDYTDNITRAFTADRDIVDTPVAQVSKIDLTLVASKNYSFVVNGETITVASAALTKADLATAIKTAINAKNGNTKVTASVDANNDLLLKGDVPGVDFTLTTSSAHTGTATLTKPIAASASSDKALKTGDLLINGVPIPGSIEENDVYSSENATSSNRAASAVAIAAAINSKSKETGVTAVPSSPVLSATSAVNTKLPATGYYSVYVNGYQVTVYLLQNETADERLNSIISAFKKQEGQHGVVASKNAAGGLDLTTKDGRNLSVWYDPRQLGDDKQLHDVTPAMFGLQSGTAVPQVSTISLGGTIAAGKEISLKINNVSVTAVAPDATAAGLATALKNAIELAGLRDITVATTGTPGQITLTNNEVSFEVSGFSSTSSLISASISSTGDGKAVTPVEGAIVGIANATATTVGAKTLYGNVKLVSEKEFTIDAGSNGFGSSSNFTALGFTEGTYGGRSAADLSPPRVGRMTFHVGSGTSQSISFDLADFGKNGPITQEITWDVDLDPMKPGDPVPTPGTENPIHNGKILTRSFISSRESALEVLAKLDATVDKVNATRATMGAVMSRLDQVITNLTNVSMNMSASRSQIEDADYASASTELAKTQIMQQAATAVLAQANTSQQSVLKLLQGG